MATQVVSRLQELFPVELSLRSVLSSPTVAALAAYVQSVGEGRGVDILEIARLAVRWSHLSEEELRAATAKEG